METVRLPLGTKANEPHIPILVSKNLDKASRVFILFGETYQALAIFAMRICGGHGGINAGSAVDLVKYIQGLPSDPNFPSSSMSATDANGDSNTDDKAGTKARPHELNPNHPGIILANMGQLRWCRREQKALTYASWNALTRPSAVHDPIVFDPLRNTVEHNRDADEHVAHILSTVVPALCHKDAKLDIIAICDSSENVTKYLDENWDATKGRMESLAVVFPTLDCETIKNEEFKDFLKKRARGYIMSENPPNSGLYGPLGGPERWQWSYGMNIYGLVYEVAEEMVFPRQFRHVVDWMQDVAKNPEYVNEEVVAVEETQEMEFDGVTGKDSEIWAEDKGKAERENDWKLERVEKSGAKHADADGVKAAEAAGRVGQWGVEFVDVEGAKAAAATAKEVMEEAVEASPKPAPLGFDDTADPLDISCPPEHMEPLPSYIKTDDSPVPVLPTKEENSAATTAEEIVEACPKPTPLGFDGAADPLDISCPPERMEPLPSYIKTDDSPVSVLLTKEEKAAILQISVVSSPVKEKDTSEFARKTSDASEMKG